MLSELQFYGGHHRSAIRWQRTPTKPREVGANTTGAERYRSQHAGNHGTDVATHWRHHLMVAPTSRMAPSAAADTATVSSLSGVGRLARIA